MAGSTFGNNFRITTWGESHGPAVGVVIDGCPSGFLLDFDAMQKYMERRKPGDNAHSTARKESDEIQILSGVYQGKTLGTPISMIFYNKDTKSKDYDLLKHIYRPGHGDAVYDYKYGIRDHRGGGRASGRETVCRVAAGSIAVQILNALGIHFTTTTALPTKEELDAIKQSKDSVGGQVTVAISGVPAGLGEPVFDKLDALLSQAVFSVGGVKAVEIGAGKKCETMQGSAFNDAILSKTDTGIHTRSNNAGGILAGISNGEEILVSASIKPTPSIGLQQDTITDTGAPTTLSVSGRHDTTIVPRAAVVIESMCAITLLDLLLAQNHARFSDLQS
ncbi:MAG: chorismate synthase [Lachnospiraceae bacterium]|nr:chorismate synthase [Lachnospiraceae bacterium]